MNAREQRSGLCGICPAGCFVTVTVEHDRLVAIEPQADHPFGMICRIGRHAPEIVHDPNRLLHPMRRTGPKSAGSFEKISWDDAYAIITENLMKTREQYGPEGAAIYTGRGSFDMALCDVFQPAGVAVSSASSVLFPFGSPNTLGVGALCYVSFAMIAPHVTMGEMLITMETDLEQAELILLWGANPATDSPPLAHLQIIKAKERGARVISIDPRRAGTAVEADARWVPIRPGTDGALALGMIQVLIEEELYDEKFAGDWTVGFEELATYVQHFRPETVERITGVAAETVRELARLVATRRGVCPVMYTGLEYSDSGVQAIRAVFTLFALAGQLDVPGGLLFRMKENTFPQNRTRLVPNPDIRKALGRDRFPLYSAYREESHAIALPDAVLRGKPYPVRSLIILGGSICTAWPQPRVWCKTLEALDFLVVIDRYPTADSAYADIVLPAATGFEITSYMRFGPLFKIREPLVPPQGEARSDFQILAGLAQHLGYGHMYPRNEEELLAFALEGSGFTLEEVRNAGGEIQLPTAMMQYRKWEKGLLRPDGKPGFDTPSGKFEIASSILAEYGYDPLPVYSEPAEGPLAAPETALTFPLVFNSGARTHYDFRSQHHGVPPLAAHHPEPILTINTHDAASRNISDGDRIRVKTPRGEAVFTAFTTSGIVRGAVDAAMGGGGPLGNEAWRTCNVNELTDLGRFDPISGFPIYKALLCQVEKITEDRVMERLNPPVEEERKEARVRVQAMRQIYLDHNATTPVAPEVLEAMLPYLTDCCGNPSSIHSSGIRARDAVEAARRIIAQALNCTARRIVFTGSGSEGNSLAILGATRGSNSSRRHLVTSSIEHPAVLAPFRLLERSGYDLTLLPATREGLVAPEELARAIRPDTLLVSVMLANNETGAVQPIGELACIAHSAGALFHCDAVQAFGRIDVDVAALGVDLLTVSAHKLHGPKGVGALFSRREVSLVPIVAGGGQEEGLRAGTENVAGIAGFGTAVEMAMERLHRQEGKRLIQLRDRLEEEIRTLVPGARRNGPRDLRLPNTLNMHLPEIRGESLVLMLDRKGICLSAGSACKSGNPDPSHALLAMGLTPAEAHCSIRLSLGYGTCEEDIHRAIVAFSEVMSEASSMVRFMACR